MFTGYWVHHSYSLPAAVTGKPIVIGGSLGRGEATGRAVMMTTLEALKRKKIPARGARIVVQGFGKVGASAAYMIDERDATVSAVIDIHGGVYNRHGLNTRAPFAYSKTHGSFAGYPETEPIDNDVLLELACDVLIPCALENQITARNAPRVQAQIIADGANRPVTPEADEILIDRDVFIIPDVLCNAGGVTVSYCEWVQGLQSFFWTEDEINERVRQIIVRGIYP